MVDKLPFDIQRRNLDIKLIKSLQDFMIDSFPKIGKADPSLRDELEEGFDNIMNEWSDNRDAIGEEQKRFEKAAVIMSVGIAFVILLLVILMLWAFRSEFLIPMLKDTFTTIGGWFI